MNPNKIDSLLLIISVLFLVIGIIGFFTLSGDSSDRLLFIGLIGSLIIQGWVLYRKKQI